MGRPSKGERDQLKARASKSVAAQLRAAAKAAGKTLSDYLIAAGLALATQAPAIAIVISEDNTTPTQEIQDETTSRFCTGQPGSMEAPQPGLPLGAASLSTARSAEGSSEASERERANPPTPLESSGDSPKPSAPNDSSGEPQLCGAPSESDPLAPLSEGEAPLHGERGGIRGLRLPALQDPLLTPTIEEADMWINPEISPEVLAALPPHADPTPACDRCHQQVVFVAGPRFTEAQRCPHCDQACQRCGGSGEWFDATYYDGAGARVTCGCNKQGIKKRLTLLNQAEIPAVYSELLVGKLPPRTLTESQRAAHITAFEWARDFGKREGRDVAKGLFFYGPPGTGKTLALCRALSYIGRIYGRSVRYVHLPDYLAQRKAAWSDEEIEVSALQELERVDVLLLDELLLKEKGKKAKLNDWDRHQLNLLLHARWNAQLPTLYATNCTPEEIESEVAESSWSRIRATSTMLAIEGADLRAPALVPPAAPKPKRNDHPWAKRGGAR